MSDGFGYVVAAYLITLAAVSWYGVTLVRRIRVARQQLDHFEKRAIDSAERDNTERHESLFSGADHE